MSLQRKFLPALAALLFAGSAQAATPAGCQLSPEQRSAFDVGALKSELSVLAVDCSNEDEYNRFVEMHRAELVARNATVQAWFERTYGRLAQKRYDSYITLLANEQGQVGAHQGSDFCPRLKPVFSEVLAVPGPLLPQYAAAKDLMPGELTPCTLDVAPAAATRPARRSERKRK